eukprot:scaffold186799_cov39-Prasinocladus_malaysianus.AAC.1
MIIKFEIPRIGGASRLLWRPRKRPNRRRRRRRKCPGPAHQSSAAGLPTRHGAQPRGIPDHEAYAAWACPAFLDYEPTEYLR